VSTAQPEAGYSGAMAGILVQDPFNSELTVADRCDRCSAQAYVRVAHGTWPSELLFCAHHGSKHVPALQDIEERDRLYAETALMKQASTEV
jgi:hypothetical protein